MIITKYTTHGKKDIWEIFYDGYPQCYRYAFKKAKKTTVFHSSEMRVSKQELKEMFQGFLQDNPKYL